MVADTRVTTVDSGGAILERVIAMGDLSKLQPVERVAYYKAVCESVGLNPLTKPFDYLTLSGKLVLYANRSCTDQLRSIKGISIDGAERDASDPDYATWIVTGHDTTSRADTEIGSVSIKGLAGEARANAIMKALTKGKRRLTLSLAGLGWLDETEVDSIPTAVRTDVDTETGEIKPRTLREQIAERKAIVAITQGTAVATIRGESGLPAAGEVEAPSDDGAPSPADMPEATPSAPVQHGQSASASGIVQCPELSPYEGSARCRREAGHDGLHRSGDRESWATPIT